MTGNPTATAPSKGHEPVAVGIAAHPNQDDRVLVDAVRAGRSEAYGILVDRYGARLHNSLLHLAGGDHETAAEFTQEAFVRAYERLDRFAGDSSFYTWLYRLARNRAIDLLAKKRPTPTDGAIIDCTHQTADRPADRVGRDELRDHVQAALYRLPTDQREIILMRDFEGLDYAAIAERLAVPTGTVKSRINRARRALRTELAPFVSGADL